MSELQKAQLLLNSNRPKEAEAEIRGMLAREPNNDRAFAFLARALYAQSRLDEAEEAVREAIHLDPQDEYNFAIMASLRIHQGRHEDALKALDESLRLNPDNGYRHFTKAAIFHDEGRLDEALQSIDEALACLPENSGFLSMRAAILNKMHRPRDAKEAVNGALRLDPENAEAYEELGWASLRLSEVRPACEAFREALRLDPDNANARSGIVEALKAKVPVYRVILAFLLWTGSLSVKARWALFIGLYIGVRILRVVARNAPTLQPFAYTVLALYGVFAFLTWTASPLCNVFLRLHPLGKHALTSDERLASTLVGSLLLLAILMATAGLVLAHAGLLVGAGCSLILMMPVSALFMIPVGPHRTRMAVLVGFAAIVAMVTLLAVYL